MGFEAGFGIDVHQSDQSELRHSLKGRPHPPAVYVATLEPVMPCKTPQSQLAGAVDLDKSLLTVERLSRAENAEAFGCESPVFGHPVVHPLGRHQAVGAAVAVGRL